MPLAGFNTNNSCCDEIVKSTIRISWSSVTTFLTFTLFVD